VFKAIVNQTTKSSLLFVLVMHNCILFTVKQKETQVQNGHTVRQELVCLIRGNVTNYILNI